MALVMPAFELLVTPVSCRHKTSTSAKYASSSGNLAARDVTLAVAITTPECFVFARLLISPDFSFFDLASLEEEVEDDPLLQDSKENNEEEGETNVDDDDADDDVDWSA